MEHEMIGPRGEDRSPETFFDPSVPNERRNPPPDPTGEGFQVCNQPVVSLSERLARFQNPWGPRTVRQPTRTPLAERMMSGNYLDANRVIVWRFTLTIPAGWYVWLKQKSVKLRLWWHS